MSTTKLKRSRHSCSAFACEHFGYFNKCDSFHSLPKDPEIKNKWIEILKIPEDQVNSPAISRNLRVCGNHFKDEDFKVHGHRKILDAEAIPSLLLEKDPETASFVAPVKVNRKRKSYDSVLASEYEDQDKSVTEGNDEEEVEEIEPRVRPKRRAAKAAEKKIIEAASSMIDDMIKDDDDDDHEEEEDDEEYEEEEERKRVSQPKPQKNIIISPATITKVINPQIVKQPVARTSIITLSSMPKIESEMVIKTPGKSILNSLLPPSISITPVESKSSSDIPAAPKPMSNRTARKSFVSSPSANIPKTQPNVNQSPPVSKTIQTDFRSLELDMQCEEEPLSICQISAYNKSMMEYQLSVNKLKKLRSENCLIRYEYEPAEAPQAMNIRSKIEASATAVKQKINI